MRLTDFFCFFCQNTPNCLVFTRKLRTDKQEKLFQNHSERIQNPPKNLFITPDDFSHGGVFEEKGQADWGDFGNSHQTHDWTTLDLQAHEYDSSAFGGGR